MSKIAIRFQGITKQFNGVYALKGISFEVQAGEIHSIVGENGAGKSTLMNILSGVHQPDDGTMEVMGKPYQSKGPVDARNQGIAMIHQELSVVTNLSVSENIFLGRYLRDRIGMVDRGRMNREAKKILDQLGVGDIRPTDKVSTLSISQRQMVEIAKAISVQAKIIVMDEPTSSLTLTETQKLLKLMEDLAAQGVTILFISHRMDEVFQVSNHITVMRDGGHIATLDREEATPAKVISCMVGRDLGDIHYIDRHIAREEVVLSAENLENDRLFNVNFSLYKGEILGFAGLVGSGRTEVARAVFGLDRLRGGRITLHGKAVRMKSPGDAIRHGIGLVTEDRKQQGLFLRMSVKNNISIGKLPLRLGFFLDRKGEDEIAMEYKKKLDIRTASINLMVGSLSGGNQQKAVIARWLHLHPDVLILDEPTRGVDVGSKAEIYDLIRELADSGVSVIVISSELPEIMRLSDRVVVMSNGTITGELSRDQLSQEAVMELATRSVVRAARSDAG